MSNTYATRHQLIYVLVTMMQLMHISCHKYIVSRSVVIDQERNNKCTFLCSNQLPDGFLYIWQGYYVVSHLLSACTEWSLLYHQCIHESSHDISLLSTILLHLNDLDGTLYMFYTLLYKIMALVFNTSSTASYHYTHWGVHTLQSWDKVPWLEDLWRFLPWSLGVW